MGRDYSNDPRIEAAARAIHAYRSSATWSEMRGEWQEHTRAEARAALAAADAAAWRHVKNTPPENELVQIMAHHDGDDHYAIAEWCCDRNCWRNRDIDMMYSPVYFDRWCHIPVPPNTAAQHSPKAIAVPEVRNDRPIPVKGGVDG